MDNKQIIDDLIDFIQSHIIKIHDEGIDKINFDAIDYYEIKEFIQSLQIKYLNHANPDMYPKWYEKIPHCETCKTLTTENLIAEYASSVLSHFLISEKCSISKNEETGENKIYYKDKSVNVTISFFNSQQSEHSLEEASKEEAQELP